MKLLKVVANNYKLCDNNFSISFVPKGNKTVADKEFELIEIDDDLFTFSTVGIIGKNASGKTATIELLSIVYDIFSNFRIKTSTKSFNFINETFQLDITFYNEGMLYRYITDIEKHSNIVDNDIILFKNEKIYRRDYKKSHSRSLFDYSKYKEITIEDKLPEDTSKLYAIFKGITFRGIFCPSDDYSYKDYSIAFNIYKSWDGNLSLMSALLKIFDEHIETVEMINDNKFNIIYTNKTSKVVTNNEMSEVLSSGTRKGFILFTLVVYSLKYGSDLLIDEIENHFHKTLVENLVNLYKDKTVNKHNAMLIFTTHYCELLDLFSRSDNIYITKYNKKITLENMHENYHFRSELSKSNKFYNNEFGTNVNYDALMKFKKELM